jgi:site-specific DNA-methyltransferase (adenine-specific)
MREHEEILVFGQSGVNYYPQLYPKPKEDIRPVTPRGKHGSVYGDYAAVSERKIPVDMSYPRSVLRFPNPNRGEQGLHPTQKPVALYRYLVRTYTRPGDLVLDFCCGSATTAEAARAEGRRWICGEKYADIVAVARDRLRMPFERRHVVKETRVDDLPLFAAVGGD